MSDLDLEAIKVRVDAATPPPWTLVGGARRAADAVFIAHAREDIPALVAEVERLRRALRTIAYYHMTGPAARFLKNALDPETEKITHDALHRAAGGHGDATDTNHDPTSEARPSGRRTVPVGSLFASEPRCGLCGYDQYARHHLSETARAYHQFVSHYRG